MTTATGAPIASDNQHQSSLGAAIFEPFKSPIVRDAALFVALLLINLFCYHRTLNGYFLADDFVHVPYLVKVFNGHPDLLLQNFYSNWVQAQGTQFYRPFISLTLALDYALWKANPAGYHVTNFLYQVASSIMLFLCTRRLFNYTSGKEASTVAFLAGAFFAASPLHPEVVSWIIARVDSVQTAFLLASFWLYLRARDKSSSLLPRLSSDNADRALSKILSIACFVTALLSKEMAITLPPTLFLLELLKCEKGNLLEKFKFAMKQTWLYWLILAVYLGVRTAALGTISGGYAGSIGQGLSSSIFKRWFQDGSFIRVLLPLNAELPASAHRLVRTLKLLYELAGVLVVARMIVLFRDGMLANYTRWLFFACAWFFIAMLPTYQVWNLTETLQGSRFIYLGTAPLSLVLALLIAPLHFSTPGGFKKILNAAAGVLAVLLVWTFMQMSYQNNSAWAQANKGVRGFRTAVENWFEDKNSAPRLSSDQSTSLQQDPSSLVQRSSDRPLDKSSDRSSDKSKLVVLNIPQRYSGAHMIYNAATLSVLLRPPLCSQDLSNKVVTFEPITFGDADLINISRLRRLLNQQTKYQFVRWDSNSQQLVSLNLVPAQSTKKIKGSEITDSTSEMFRSFLVSPPIDIASTSVDFVDITLNRDQKKSKPSDVVTMSWNTSADPNFRSEHSLSKAIEGADYVRFDVSEHKNWVLSETIHQLKFELPNGVAIKSVLMQNGTTLMPTLTPDTTTASAPGRSVVEDVGGVSRPGPNIGYFNYDASKIPGADHVVVEISKADSWFEHYSGTYRDKKLSPETSFVLKEAELKKEHFSTPAKQLDRPGFYEIRVSAVDKNGKLIGYPSDPISLQFSAEDIRK